MRKKLKKGGKRSSRMLEQIASQGVGSAVLISVQTQPTEEYEKI